MNARASVFLVGVLGCQTVSDGGPAPATSHATAAAVSPHPADVLDDLDPRKAVPLLPMMAHHQKENMRDHLLVVQRIVAATARGDFAEVAHVSKGIGYSEAMGRMCEHMGAGTPGFTEQALAFHHAADGISRAATKQDAAAVLGALSETLSACTSCHASYKQRVVGELAP
ncbi:MAG TPA: cytochrome c [Polyangiaceae bacterium]|nr:cytochrome c [Polyangiaceae bacterium]